MAAIDQTLKPGDLLWEYQPDLPDEPGALVCSVCEQAIEMAELTDIDHEHEHREF